MWGVSHWWDLERGRAAGGMAAGATGSESWLSSRVGLAAIRELSCGESSARKGIHLGSEKTAMSVKQC